MAAPVDADRVTTDGSSSSTTQSLNLPGSISAGDILFAIIRCPTDTLFTWPGDWEVISDSNKNDASDDTTGVAWKIADGSEGATISIGLGTAGRLAGLCYLITGGDTKENPASVTGSASQPNSPTFTLVGGETRDVLWLSLFGIDFTKTLTSGPASYANATIIANTGGAGAGNCTVGGASRQVTADLTEDPGAWTLTSTGIWTAYTFAIYAAAPDARISQIPVEAVVSPTSGQARISQIPVEAVLLTEPPLRLTQEPVEALVQPDTVQVRMTQEPVEALVLPDTAQVRMTQMPVEVLVEFVEVTDQLTFQAIIFN